MKITVSAKPKKKKAYIEQLTPTFYVVAVKEPAVDGRANQAILAALAEYFHLNRSQISLVTGHTGKLKVFEVPDHLIDFEPLPKQKTLFND